MENMDKLSAIRYLTNSKPICDNCLRGDLNQVRKAAGLYQLVKDIIAGKQEFFSHTELDLKITKATIF